MKVSVSVVSLIFAAALPLIGALPAAQFDQPASNKVDRRFLHDIFVTGAAAVTGSAHIHARSHVDALKASAAAAASAAATLKVDRRGLLGLGPINGGAAGAATATATLAINTQEGCGCPTSPTTSSTPTHTTTHTTTTTAHPTSTPGAPGAPGAPGTPGTPGAPGGSSHPAPTTTVTVTASGTHSGPAPTGTTCSTGPVQCCNSIQSSDSSNAAGLLGLLGVVLQGVNVPIGITCNPISVLGLGSAGTCNAQTVCCENNNFNGLVAIGCTPINLGL